MPRAARSPGAPAESAATRSRENRSLLSSVPILAHLDLDAFFAAVEELEDPSLRTKPLVVGGDPRGRGVVATANYVARRYGIRSAMSAAEALRRCPRDRLRPATPRALPPVLQRGLGSDRGGRAARRAHRDRRGLPRPGQRGLVVRRCPQAGRGRPGRRPGHDLALVLARRLDLQGGLQGRLRPTQAGRHHRRATRARGAIPRSAAEPHPPRRRAEVRRAARSRRRAHDRRARGARRRRAAGGAPGPGGAAAARQGQRRRPARARAREPSASRSRPRRPSTATSPTAPHSMRSCVGWRPRSPRTSSATGSRRAP